MGFNSGFKGLTCNEHLMGLTNVLCLWVAWPSVRMSVLAVFVGSNRYDGPIWSAWRATCALCMLQSLLKISTLC